MSSQTLALTPALNQYLQNYGVNEHPILKALREETLATFEAAPMQICPEQGQFFQWLLKLMGAKRALEIGTFTGYSALAIALGLPENGQLTCCDISHDWTRVALKYFKKMQFEEKITLHIAPALNTLQKLLDQGEAGSYDFAFIDADKPNNPAYYEHCLHLLKQGGVIAIDNVLWSGEVINPQNQDENTQAIRALNEKVRQDTRVSICMLPIADGLTLAQKVIP